MKNQKFVFGLKAVAAMIVAFIILNLVCMFYYNVPAHRSSKTNSTDYLWENNKFYSRGTEGFAMGVTDKNGFNNLKTFEKGEIDVLVMGSSHMEAFNVAQDKNTTAILNNQFQASGIDMNAYNIGISGHVLVRCLNNLGNAVNEFEPQKYVIIETQSIMPTADSVKSALDGTLPPMELYSDGIVAMLQRFPYLRLVYAQLKNAGDGDIMNDESEGQKSGNEKIEQHQLLNSLIKKSAKTCEEAGVKLIIFYNCAININEQGKIIERVDVDDVEAFRTICENNGVVFVDMYDSFKENYTKTYKMPRGFSNSKVGSGHLNKEGHRVIAEKLFSVICK